MSDIKQKLIDEARRIDEDTEHSAKGHLNAADRWGRYHLLIGLPAALLAALAGVMAFNNCPQMAGGLALLSTALTTVLTFLKPSEKSDIHKAVGDQFLTIRNQARIFREIELEDCDDLKVAKQRLLELADQRDNLNQASPNIPRKDYESAKSDIDEGRSRHKVDID